MPIQPDMIGIVVRNMGAALAFYRALGLAIPDGKDDEPYVDVITPNGYRISWNTLEMVKSIEPHWIDPVGVRMSMAFKCGSPAEVDEVHARLIGAGYRSHKSPFDAFWGQRYATVLDPDDNPVDLFAPLG